MTLPPPPGTLDYVIWAYTREMERASLARGCKALVEAASHIRMRFDEFGRVVRYWSDEPLEISPEVERVTAKFAPEIARRAHA